MCVLILLSRYYDSIVTHVISLPVSSPADILESRAIPAVLALYLAMSINQTVNMVVRNLVETSRILERFGKLIEVGQMPVEAAAIIESNRPPAEWPTKGDLQFKNLFVKYRPNLDFVLRDINVHILSSEKIGVVGRTGAGKSSLMSALFRLLEFHSGSIILDGVDISSIGLDDLRSKLAIINQDPVLFGGTVRSNLDPFGKYDDHQIWQALERALIKDVIEGLE